MNGEYVQSALSVNNHPSIIDLRLIEAMPGINILLLADPDSFTILSATEEFVQITGKEKKSIIGRGLFETFPGNPEDPQDTGVAELRASLQKVIQDKVRHHLPVQRYDVLNENGIFVERYWKATNTPVLDENESVLYIVHNSQEITDEIKARQNREKLKEIEDAYNLFMQAPIGIYILMGMDLTIHLVNEPALALWGKDRSIFGRSLKEAIPELAEQTYIELLQRVIQNGKTYKVYEHPVLIEKNGIATHVYLNFVCQPFFEKGATISSGVLVMMNEVTEQVITRKKMEESEEKYRGLFESMDQGFCIVEMIFDHDDNPVDYLFLESNPVFEMQTGLKDAIGKTVRQLVPNLEESWFNIYGNVARTGKAIRFVEGSNVMNRWFEAYAFRIGQQNSHKVAILFTDITERKKNETALKESEQRFRNLADDSPMFVFIIGANAEASIEYWNKTWLDYTGQSIEIALGRAWDGIVHPDDIDTVLNIYGPAFTARQPYLIPSIRVKRFDGEYRWHAFKGNPRYLSDGTFNGYVGVGFDIHEQKLAEVALQESEKRFRSLADHSPMIVFIVEADPEAKISYFNKAWLDYTGIPLEEALGRGWDGIVHPDDVQEVLRIYLPAFQNRTSYLLPAIRLKRYDGEYRWHMFKGNPRYLEHGEFIGFVGMGLDIHEAKLVEDALKESEKRFRTLAETLPQLVWITNEKGEQEYASSQWKEYSGIDPKGDDTWQQLVHPDDLIVISKAWGNSLAQGALYRSEARLRNKNGEYRWHFVQGDPIRNQNGIITKWIGAFTDIHDQKESEQKLEALVAQRTIDLERSNEDLLQFAHVASHDLREPVRKINVFSTRLQEEFNENLNEKARSYVAKIKSAADRMFTMIDGVLTYSTINASDESIITLDLNQIIRNIETDLEVAIQQKETIIECGDLPQIEGTPVLIYQLFYNLINNSLKFAKPGIPLRIVITSKTLQIKKRSYAQIRIEDNGIGFEQEYAEKIFDNFVRLHPKDKYEGTGLGLALCEKIVQRHDGQIAASGKVGKGASFIITLPFIQKQ
ncbi:MAG TPA: PAS domain S-box protein [Flavitalea sp.]|nr:PAS domain S-box protein [Flavitalea sp.]